jgi:hypothetical protein
MMADDLSQQPAGGDLRCPTCGAVQEWSDVCRRCRCDLTLLRRVADAERVSRGRCLAALRGDRIPEALDHARRLYCLHPGPTASRLLAVCHLLHGNWRAAASLAVAGKWDR